MEGMSRKQVMISSVIMVLILLACVLGVLFGASVGNSVSYQDAARNGDKFARSIVQFCKDPVAVQNGYCDQLKRQWEQKMNR